MNTPRPGGIDTSTREVGFARFARNRVVLTGAMAVVIALLCAPHQARGDEQYVSKEYGFSLIYPEDVYEEQPVESDAGVVFILKNRAGGFPTFTVSTGAGGYQPTSDANHANNVVNEYRRVGFRDAQVVKVMRYVQRGIPLQAPLVVVVFSSQVPVCERRSRGRVEQWNSAPQFAPFDYTSGTASPRERALRRIGKTAEEGCRASPMGSEPLLRSKVLSVSTPSRHYTLTYMDYAEKPDRGESRRLFDNFFIGAVKGAIQEEFDAGRHNERPSSWRVSAREVMGLFTPILNGLMELTYGDLRPEEPSRMPARRRSYAEEDESNELFSDRPRPLASDFLNSTLPTSQGGQLFGLLALFVSGVMLKRLRRR